MARAVYKRLTQPVFNLDGSVAHQPGELIPVDVLLDPAARYEYAVIDEPDPAPPAPEPKAAEPKSATVKAAPAEGKGSSKQ